jgi:hypothetical protein
MSIPKLIHQLWVSPETPAKFSAFRESWLARNPDWTMRLWTDEDLAGLVETRYPELTALYGGYRHPIARADLGRYLVLETFGGVYADLDCECLRPLEPLLRDARFVIGLEPDEHLRELGDRAGGLTRILCPSFIASVAGHPLWRDIRIAAQAAAPEDDVLDQTGPFMLTRAFEASPAGADVRLAPSAQIYPFTRAMCWSGDVFDLELWERATRHAFVAHYWDGGWFRKPTPLNGLPSEFKAKVFASSKAPPDLPDKPDATLVSCITALDGAVGLELAIESYRRQTHQKKELLVVCHALESEVGEIIRRTGRSDIRLLVAPSDDELGLLAEGARHAAGDVLCQWDAGALHDAARLEIQLSALWSARAHACVLERSLAWRPDQRRLATTTAERPSESSLMWLRGAFGEEWLGRPDSTQLILAEGLHLASVDVPRLIVKICADDEAGFGREWASASVRFDGERCDAVVGELAKRLPIALAEPRDRSGEPKPGRLTSPGEILILTPIKDARRHLPRYFELAKRLETGGAPLSIALLEGDSVDGTYEALQQQLPACRDRFARVLLLQRHDGFEIRGPRWTPGIQRARRATIARARNRLLAEALGEAEWALWLDADVVDYPADLFMRMAGTGKDIVAAHCIGRSGRTFDYNTFVFDSTGQDDPAYLVDGLFQPPVGAGRKYLGDFADRTLVRVDGVGGSALLVRGQLHRDGLNFPAFSYRGYIETEGLAMMARDMGYECWATPQLRVTHASDE